MKLIVTHLALAMLLIGCTATPYRTDVDFDRSVAFTEYESWAFISDHPMAVADGTLGSNPLWERRIMTYIADALTATGYRRTDEPAAADFTVSFTVGSRERLSVQDYPAAYRGAWFDRWGGIYYGYPMEREVTLREYTEGQLAIDIFDVDERRAVWHGSAKGDVREGYDQAEREALARQAVDSILAGFPPG